MGTCVKDVLKCLLQVSQETYLDVTRVPINDFKAYNCDIMAKTAKRELGDRGEKVVCKYLEGRGYRILERNYWKPWGEIDIVAEKASKLSFIEVKTVSRATALRPEENMHPAKVKRLHRAIQTYLLDHKVPESKDWQLDLASVRLDFSTRQARVEFIENIIL